MSLSSPQHLTVATRTWMRWGLATVLVVAVVVTGGCDSRERSHAPLSKRQYIEQFNTQQRDAAQVFQELDAATRDPRAAQSHLARFDSLIAALEGLRPPRVWAHDHATMVKSLRDMRTSLGVIARAPSSRTAVIATQVGIYSTAQRRFQAAVRHVNATR